MRGLTGATVVLVLFTYPYVYLPVAARLASLPPSLEENARILGRSPAYAFGRIVLPQYRDRDRRRRPVRSRCTRSATSVPCRS